MNKDEQARARLVEIAIGCAYTWAERALESAEAYRQASRIRAGMKHHTSGSWCAAGLTAAMEDAGLVVPAPGTPARRGAVALLDFVGGFRVGQLSHYPIEKQIELAQPGDIIAWLQNKPPAEWLHVNGEQHAFATKEMPRSMCGKAGRATSLHLPAGKRCSSCVWDTRKGHVALIVAVDDESITAVGWNEGPSPGRVMKRRLWRDPQKVCTGCNISTADIHCQWYGLRHTVTRTSTVPYRRPGGLYGIARPVAR
jgi:hypothetical protein